ncbi:MCP four helix bundle domain-containing protein [uncultured Roseivirga sp.]|uniref:MCP four helix bundle domain-containing protein n=1 Tax=uncultured Roseivirga sp. TaxID=543088 RepID=UPI0030D8D683|tara:strand:- start:53828 stop:54496 length:669 start_codon:yes stop_codon:yes gene_type:complete
MKWTYSIKNKITAAVLLAAIMIITLANNLVERSHFKQLDASFASMYEDRMLVESYIFKLYENLHKRQALIIEPDPQNGFKHLETRLSDSRAQRNQLIEKYATTYLTPEEEVEFERLKGVVENIDKIENQLVENETSIDQLHQLVSDNNETTTKAFSSLSALSSIQTTEAQTIREESEKIILGNITISQLEMAILVIIGLFIQALIFSSKSLKTTVKQKPHLN